MAHNTLLDYSNLQKQFDIYINVKRYPTLGIQRNHKLSWCRKANYQLFADVITKENSQQTKIGFKI